MIAAADSLKRDQRLTLMNLFDRRDRYDDPFDAVVAVVAGDVELYRRWYRGCSDDLLKLDTLRRRPDEAWYGRAAVAMDEGRPVSELCDMVGEWLHSWSRSLSAYYQGLVPLYEGMTRHADAHFHPPGRAGVRWAQQRAARETFGEGNTDGGR